ncbi:MAG: FxsA family protein [Proteobacteria bacterium]|nr:FxsA family protein [Pseudomonadota bacterium]
MISTLIFSGIAVTSLDIFSLIYLSGNFPLAVFIISQMASGITGLILLKQRDVKVIYFIENQLKNRAPVIKEVWFECVAIIGCISLCFPGYISDIIGIVLLQEKTQIKLHRKITDLIIR